MNAKIRAGIAPVCSGIVAGLVVAVFYTSNGDKEQQQQTMHIPTKAEISVTPNSDDAEKLAKSNQSKLSLIQDQLNELKKQQAVNDSNEQVSELNEDKEKTTSEEILTEEQAKAAELAWWDNINYNFQQEQYDSNWAPAAANNFQQDISGLASDGGFTLVNTDCRTNRCAVTVEFESYAKATEKYADLLHYEYKTNCARQTLLREPDRTQGAAPYQATFIFDCSDQINLG